MAEDEGTLESVLAQEQPAFAAALENVVTADTEQLGQRLAQDPSLARARSSSEHGATLLHYVAANGVETPLQTAPGTIYQFLQRCSAVERGRALERAVQVPKLLLEAGAEVDALCGTYGGGPAQTTLNLLVSSAHPFLAGVQEILVRVLTDAGAAVDGVDDDQSPLVTALGFGYHGAVRTLVECGARADGLIVSAAAGDEEAVRAYFPDGRLGSDVGSVPFSWFAGARDPAVVAEQALVYASMCGQRGVMEILLDHGVDVNAMPPGTHVTAGPLHTAALAGQHDAARLLIERGADLYDSEPRYGGDPLSWADHGGFTEIVQLIEEARKQNPR